MAKTLSIKFLGSSSYKLHQHVTRNTDRRFFMSHQIDSDVFLEDVWKFNSYNCPVCGAVCTVKRNTSVKFIKSHCDIFYCPHRGKAWHYKAASLKRFIKQVPSKRLHNLIEKDIKRLVNNKN